MKKIIFSLMTLGVAGLLVSAVAQNAPGGNNPPTRQSNRRWPGGQWCA